MFSSHAYQRQWMPNRFCTTTTRCRTKPGSKIRKAHWPKRRRKAEHFIRTPPRLDFWCPTGAERYPHLAHDVWWFGHNDDHSSKNLSTLPWGVLFVILRGYAGGFTTTAKRNSEFCTTSGRRGEIQPRVLSVERVTTELRGGTWHNAFQKRKHTSWNWRSLD